jgi:hypothetical protein
MEEIEEEQEDNPNTVVPATFNLDIPFYAQAPDGNWELPWKEACEEASIILAHYFLADRSALIVQVQGRSTLYDESSGRDVWERYRHDRRPDRPALYEILRD